jgi:hypothetical protein
MLLDSTSLRPSVPIDMGGSLKIVGLADATDKQEAMTLGQSLRHQWIQASLSADITTSFASTYTVPFGSVLSPGALTTPVTSNLSNSSGTITLSPGKYMVNLMIGAYYESAVSQPVNMAFVGATSGVNPLLDVVTARAPAFGVQSFTTASAIVDVATQEDFTMRLTNTTYL